MFQIQKTHAGDPAGAFFDDLAGIGFYFL